MKKQTEMLPKQPVAARRLQWGREPLSLQRRLCNVPSHRALSSEELEQYRMRLRGMRDQLDGEIDKVVDSLRAELDTAGNLSTVPVHMGDIAPDQVDADIDIIETERGMMEAIQAALHRIDDGTFGKCTDCGQPIGQERLEAIPYTPHCIRCAKERS